MNVPLEPEFISFELHRIIPAPRWQVLRMLTRLSDFPEMMPNVKEVRVLKKERMKTLSEWRVEIDNLPISWRQESFFDSKTFSLHFNATEGDFGLLEGEWVIDPSDIKDASILKVKIKADLGIPVFGNIAKPILESHLERNFEMMLGAIEKKVLELNYQREGLAVKSPRVGGFVVMGHPYNINHLMSYFKVFKPDIEKINPEFLLKVFQQSPTFKTADVVDFKSKTGVTTNGYFVLCPLIPDMAILSPEIVLPKVVEGCHLAEKLGAGILALGGFTSIVGEMYIDRLKSQVKIPITTGNAFTTAMAVEGIRRAARLFELEMKSLTISVIGGTGDIGSACARILCREAKEIIVTGRRPQSVKDIVKELKAIKGAKVSGTLNNDDAVRKADIIVAAASSATSIVCPTKINPGAIVCDVGYPKNIGHNTKDRDDIFVFSGGLSTTPTKFDLGFNVGLPSPDVLYGCFAEAIILSLEGEYVNFSEGKGRLTTEKVEHIREIGAKHGFELAPFYCGSEQVSDEQIQQIKERVSLVRK